jgi:hypothetical protein
VKNPRVKTFNSEVFPGRSSKQNQQSPQKSAHALKSQERTARSITTDHYLEAHLSISFADFEVIAVSIPFSGSKIIK